MSCAQDEWHFADENARLRLGGNPFALFEHAECIKSNPVREVLHVPGMYLKLDKRSGHSFESEFQAAQFVKNCGIPAVEHWACGRYKGNAVLITEEAADCCDLIKFAKTPSEPRFLEDFALFIKQILQAPLFHPDFHLGNILYQKAANRFLLIDLHGVRRRTLFDRCFMMHRMYRILLEWREGVPDSRLLELLTLAGVPNPALFLPQQLKREAAHLKHEFPRRARQILSGYPKFTQINERGIVAANLSCLEEGRAYKESRKLFLLHFFLKLARIPHTAVAGITSDARAFYPGTESKFRLPPEDLTKRLHYYGFKVSAELAAPGYLVDLRPVLEYNRKVFQSYVL